MELLSELTFLWRVQIGARGGGRLSATDGKRGERDGRGGPCHRRPVVRERGKKGERQPNGQQDRHSRGVPPSGLNGC